MVEKSAINGSLECINLLSTSSVTIGNTTFSSSPSGCVFNNNFYPSVTNVYSIGTPNNVVKSIYISTGTVFIGPTGSLQIDNNGVLSSTNGFSTPFLNTSLVSFTGGGKMYFQSGSSTGCHITGLNYNSSGANHYVYYNNETSELSHTSPSYFYIFSTGTFVFPFTNSYTGVPFNVNNVMYHTFQHSSGSSVFTGTFDANTLLQITYTIQIHSTSNQNETFACVLYIDNSPVAGSYKSTTVNGTSGEFVLANATLMTWVTPGSHKFELQAAVTNLTVQVGGNPNIAAPSGSYSSASISCTKII